VRLVAWGRLLRLSLAPSAAADVAAGLTIAHAGAASAPELWWLVPSSLCIYHGSMALNDWSDRAEDERVRPDRPIPSGAIDPRAALAAALLLLLGGVAFAALALPAAALWMGGVALCASFYNLAGRGPWLGPLLLAACRAGNLGVGWFCVERLQAESFLYRHFGDASEPFLDGPPAFAIRVVAAYGLYCSSSRAWAASRTRTSASPWVRCPASGSSPPRRPSRRSRPSPTTARAGTGSRRSPSRSRARSGSCARRWRPGPGAAASSCARWA
jgi:hypothetical protein